MKKKLAWLINEKLKLSMIYEPKFAMVNHFPFHGKIVVKR